MSKFLNISKYISMVTTIICVFLWIPDILKELRNVLYESVLKTVFSGLLLTRKVDKNNPWSELYIVSKFELNRCTILRVFFLAIHKQTLNFYTHVDWHFPYLCYHSLVILQRWKVFVFSYDTLHNTVVLPNPDCSLFPGSCFQFV